MADDYNIRVGGNIANSHTNNEDGFYSDNADGGVVHFDPFGNPYATVIAAPSFINSEGNDGYMVGGQGNYQFNPYIQGQAGLMYGGPYNTGNINDGENVLAPYAGVTVGHKDGPQFHLNRTVGPSDLSHLTNLQGTFPIMGVQDLLEGGYKGYQKLKTWWGN
ncbi:MAG: hypothetical protein NZ824_05435 [Candidatus Thioglobus sp.]|nr:hypothetical protein [Candidatus Thioglobus sp.]